MKEQRAVHNLKRVIWSLDDSPPWESLNPYADHYKRLLAVYRQLLNLQGPGEVVELVQIIKREKLQDIETIRKSIREGSSSCLPHSSSDEALDYAIKLVVQLWLFTDPDLTDSKRTLRKCISSALSTVSCGTGNHSKDVLSSDFCEKSLTKKGGITIVWTSDLLEHLNFESKTRLRVFRHASALRIFNDLKSDESMLFPTGFLWETDATLRLLLQPNNHKNSRRNRKLARHGLADLETAIEKSAPLELDRYPIWGHRLMEVQRRYDAAKPGALQQWWYDRRNKPEWATFWIAVVVFVLTLFFGVISAVTSIMQLYIAFRVPP